MSIWVSLFVIVAGVFLFITILRAIVHKRISESNGLLWLIPSIALILFGIFPDGIMWLAKAMGVDYAPSLMFMIAIFLILYIIFRCTEWIADLYNRVQELGIQVSLLNQENMIIKKERDDALRRAEEDQNAS